MKWPWVSRHALDVAEKYATFLENSLSAEKARNDGLQERLLSLKMVGAVEPPPIITPAHPDCPVCRGSGVESNGRPCGNCVRVLRTGAGSDELKDLIDQRSAGNLRIRGMMLKQLAQDRADGMQDDDIRQRILDGVQSEGLPS